MDFHLDCGLSYKAGPEHKTLYSWAINEVDAEGRPLGRDQIPWNWSLYFSATSCVLTNRFEISAPTSLWSEERDAPRIEADQAIHMTLRPGAWRNGSFENDVMFSLFGTRREIKRFSLDVRAIDDPATEEGCEAWGSVAYTMEVDFHTETTEDCLCFYLAVKRATFDRYAELINRGALDTIVFTVRSVEGFYAEWSPSISTDAVKVLLRGDEHQIALPPDTQSVIPRLGKVHEARLMLQRHLLLASE